MTFNDNARINPDGVSRRGRNTGIAVGGGGPLASDLRTRVGSVGGPNTFTTFEGPHS